MYLFFVLNAEIKELISGLVYKLITPDCYTQNIKNGLCKFTLINKGKRVALSLFDIYFYFWPFLLPLKL